MLRRRVTVLATLALSAGSVPGARVGDAASHPDVSGFNPHPVRLVRPPARPLTGVARLGRAVFFDVTLSGSGKMSCATCHSPAHAYGPPDGRSVQQGGAAFDRQGLRAVPSLCYLDRVPPFGIGTDAGGSQDERPARAARSLSWASSSARAVPHGGLFWDGRGATLQRQALAPLFNPAEMANTSVASVADKLRRASYASRFAILFGAAAVATSERLVDEAMFAVARFELEDPSFHPYDSKYDAWLEGKVGLSPAELRGLRVFDAKGRGNCAACHLDRPGRDGRPPTFTDYEYEALGVPRNARLRVNSKPGFHDLGLCGPERADLSAQRRYCGLFRTPTLRNVATRHVFFHNGVYHSLEDALTFYALRDTHPERIYPTGPGGEVEKFDDLPAAYRGNVDTVDAPLDRHQGDPPVLTPRDVRDLAAFLRTLTDGYGRAGK